MVGFGSTKHTRSNVAKDVLKTRLQWIISSCPQANPSRTTLKRVNDFLLSPFSGPPTLGVPNGALCSARAHTTTTPRGTTISARRRRIPHRSNIPPIETKRVPLRQTSMERANICLGSACEWGCIPQTRRRYKGPKKPKAYPK
ncbi:hypothetical protein J3R82DRAFT_1419 [Butyriboletus roseoflavus]|nr:hypothetical protein J3R82DRAFT_1419 [Butyriboletus roseoflavus]